MGNDPLSTTEAAERDLGLCITGLYARAKFTPPSRRTGEGDYPRLGNLHMTAPEDNLFPESPRKIRQIGQIRAPDTETKFRGFTGGGVH